jgi:hypothetical protein
MHSITEPFDGVLADTNPLDIVVPYTTPELTRVALNKAEELSWQVPSSIRIVRMQRVPFPLALSQPPVSAQVLREQTREIASGMQVAEIAIYLTREPVETLLSALRPRSILVIASKRRWWRTPQERPT